MLVPGTHATEDRFDSFTTDLSNSYRHKATTMKITVTKELTLDYSGAKLTPDTHRPFIVIAFEDNSEHGILNQAEGLAIALEDLYQRYHFKQFDAVGHSNGGLVLTNFLEYHSTEVKTQLRQLVTVATPYNDTRLKDNGTSKDLTKIPTKTHLLTNFIDRNSFIPKSLAMLNITGDIKGDHGSDGIVPVNSALSGALIYQDVIQSYQEKVVTGKGTSHSDILIDDTTQAAIIAFLYQ